MDKLAIDKKLLGQILQEENHTHDAAIRELEETIAYLDEQMKPSFKAEDIQSQKLSEPAQESPEPAQKIPDDVNKDPSVEELQERARELLQESDHTAAQSEVEAPQETSKKKKRGPF